MTQIYLFEITMLIAIAVVGFFCVSSGRQRSGKTWRAHLILGFVFFEMLFYLASLINTNVTMAYVFMSSFLIMMDCSLYQFVRFCTEYTNEYREQGLFKSAAKILIGVDALILIANVFTPLSYEMVPVQKAGHQILVWQGKNLFLIHGCISYLMLISAVYVIAKKLWSAPKMYKNKFNNLLIILLSIITLNVCYILLDWNTDKSVLVCGLATLWVYYNAVVFTPNELLHSATLTVVGDLEDAIVIADSDENCIYTNELAIKLLGLEKGKLSGTDILHGWCDGRQFSEVEDFVKYVDLENKDGITSSHLKLMYRKMYDSKNRYEGSYFQIRDLTDEVNKMEADMYHARHDSVTGFYNRERFLTLCDEKLKNEPEDRYTFLYTDLSNFKLINDTMGVEKGDEVLRSMGEELRSILHPDDIYGRLENDHFAVLTKRFYFDEKKLKSLLNNIKVASVKLGCPLTMYFGIYHVEDNSLSAVAIQDRAKMALQQIKGSSENHLSYYDDSVRLKSIREREIINSLGDAIENGEIQIALQAQTDVNGVSKGAEALVRWVKRDGTIVYPNEFIPALEESGAISRLDKKVWELACKTLHSWKMAGKTDYYISVNISTKDFFFVDLYEHFTGLVKEYDISPANLKLEITETAIMSDTDRNLDIIKKLREAGFTVEIDDFGSGYSSLNTLKDISADVVKLDMAFLGKSENELRGREIIRSVISMVKDLKMDIVSEGVETKEHVEMLKSMGCDTFQGYFFSKPVAVETYQCKFM